MTLTSFLVPAAGVVTAPVLARALSAAGRGELAAALAPSALMLAAATLGLPDALTYYLAKRPSATRHGLLWGAAITTVLGIVCTIGTWLALPFLSSGDQRLAGFIALGTVCTIPALVVGLLRGAASGRQLWRVISFERIILSGGRVVLFVTLWVTGTLTVFTAVLVNALLPIAAGLVYLVLLARPPHDQDEPDVSPNVLGSIMQYGSKVWLGSIASMLVSRIAPLLMAPLSSTTELGYYTVASTISDLPLIVALAIQGALFGVNSRSSNADQVTATGRLTLLAGSVGCIVLGGTLPFWIGPLFGSAFVGATLPTIMLLASALICIPGLMAASGLSAWGRPAVRSIGLGITLVANLGSLVPLVQHFGVYGACWTSIISNVVLTTTMVVPASRIMKVPATDFFLIRGADVRRAINEAKRGFALVSGRFSRASA